MIQCDLTAAINGDAWVAFWNLPAIFTFRNRDALFLRAVRWSVGNRDMIHISAWSHADARIAVIC